MTQITGANQPNDPIVGGTTIFNPDLSLGLRYESLKCKKSAPFIRNSQQRYGYRRKGGEASDLKQFRLGIDFLMAIPGLYDQQKRID